jgi:flagellar hook assembly protein FlgD
MVIIIDLLFSNQHSKTIGPETGITNVQNSSDINISPNPFINKTTITVSLKKESKISVEIFSLTGERIRTIINTKSYQSGLLHFIWDKKNDSGIFVKPGLYLCRIAINEEKYLRKIAVK